MVLNYSTEGVRRRAGDQEAQLLHRAKEFLQQKQYKEALDCCRRVLEQNSESAEGYFLMGIIACENHDYRNALGLFEGAVRKGYPGAGPFVQAARSLVGLNQPAQALKCLEQAKKRNPRDGYTLALIGSTLSKLDRHEEAVAFHRKATQASPGDALSFFNLGSSLQFLGDFENAREAYRTALKLNPGFTAAQMHLTQITKQTPERNDLAVLQKAWAERDPRDAEGGLVLAHAIAKVHEDLGDPESVMLWLDRGKALVRPQLPDRQMEDQFIYKAAGALAGALRVEGATPAVGPVFIVGLPRSGTTLVDRVLSSHSQIVSAGERHEFGACLHRAAGVSAGHTYDAEVISRAANTDLTAVGQAYLKSVRAILESDQRFTDKMPVNAFFVPAILAALPSSRVICLRRQAPDSVLSIYKQHFSASASLYSYAYDLERLARYVADFHDLADTYEQKLPGTRFRIVNYERLVGSPDSEIRDILAFAGLGFEAACLDFHKNESPVATASVSQVRQPIYTSAIGRWTQYKAALQPALAVLRDRGRL
ncbi:sulfotransferase [Hyphomonas jannaschiana]|uniref:sulfotransferase n=1 Tax=Hyphomonas jannaschiana TaxID=86 RepID=UPI0035C6EBA6